MAPQSKARQKTSFLRDFFNRAGRYGKDLLRCGALWFSLGNVVFASVTGGVLGLTVGTIIAAGIQTAIASYVAVRQFHATYNGRDFGAPYRVMAYANYATAATLLTVGMAGGPLTAAAAAIPAAVFLTWGRAHHNIGAVINRVDELKRAGLSPEALEQDEKLLKLTRAYQWQGGAADIMAVIKDKPVHELGQFLTQPHANLDALVPMAFFGLGLKKTFNLTTPLDKPAGYISRVLGKITPGFLKSAFDVPGKGVTPNRYYTMGYVAGAALSLAKPGFALAQLFWSYGYYCLDMRRDKPVSADEYAAQVPLPALPDSPDRRTPL